MRGDGVPRHSRDVYKRQQQPYAKSIRHTWLTNLQGRSQIVRKNLDVRLEVAAGFFMANDCNAGFDAYL